MDFRINMLHEWKMQEAGGCGCGGGTLFGQNFTHTKNVQRLALLATINTTTSNLSFIL